MEVSLFHWCRGTEKKKLNDLNNSGYNIETGISYQSRLTSGDSGERPLA